MSGACPRALPSQGKTSKDFSIIPKVRSSRVVKMVLWGVLACAAVCAAPIVSAVSSMGVMRSRSPSRSTYCVMAGVVRVARFTRERGVAARRGARRRGVHLSKWRSPAQVWASGGAAHSAPPQLDEDVASVMMNQTPPSAVLQSTFLQVRLGPRIVCWCCAERDENRTSLRK